MSVEKTSRITPSNPSTALVDLRLRAVALCNEGANSRADIIMTKRKENATMPKTYEELLQALQPDQAEILTKHIAGITADHEQAVAKLNQTITELNGKVENLEKAAPAPAEDVTKGMSPEVAELFKRQQATIDQLLADKADTLAAQRFEKCKAIPVAEDELKNVLKTASPAMVAILEKAAAAILDKTHTPEGSSANPEFVGTSADDLYGKLEKSAHEIMKQNTGLSFEQAFTQACSADPETYRKYTEGV